MLSSNGRYGLKALICLARAPEGEIAQVANIAARNNISKKFLDAILLDLRSAGFVRSRKGPGGGYMLAKPATEIMIGDVVREIDGPLAPIACNNRSAYSACPDCIDPDLCGVRMVMYEVRDAIADILDHTTLASLAERGRSRELVWDYAI